MDRVVTVNLGGNAYQLEEAAYASLSAYLSSADRALAANPDKAEIVKDLEAAIADRIVAYLRPHKTVVTAAEMAEALAAMGPVEGAEAAGAESPNPADPPRDRPKAEDARRRLFRLREGAMLAGVCTGLAAYTRIDLALVRIGVVVAALFAPWFMLIAYVVAMFAIPSANTAEEWSAAHGLPATAQQIIEEGRRRFDQVNAKPFVFNWTFATSENRPEPQRFTAPPAPPAGLGMRLFAGAGALVLTVVGAALTLALLFGMASLVLYNQVLGYTPDLDAPTWAILLGVALVFAAVALPLQTLRQGAFRTMADVGPTQARAMDALVSFGMVAFGGWLAWQAFPQVQVLVSDVLWVIRD